VLPESCNAFREDYGAVMLCHIDGEVKLEMSDGIVFKLIVKWKGLQTAPPLSSLFDIFNMF
jgi:hypothetical protein